MTVTVGSSPFGSTARTRVLLALRLLGSSHARELARVLDLALSGVQRALLSLERDGFVAGRAAGRTKLFRLEPRYFAREELDRFLRRRASPDTGALAHRRVPRPPRRLPPLE